MGGLRQAQRQELRSLVDNGVLLPEQGEAVGTALTRASTRGDGRASWLVEAAGYVGGGLMLGGVTLFVATSWDELTRYSRSALLAAFALLFVAIGVAAAGGPRGIRRLATGDHAARRRIVGVLFGLAAVPAALATAVAVDAPHAGSYAGLVGFAVALAGMLLVPTVAGLVAAAFMSVVAVASFGKEVLHASDLNMGLLLIVVGVAWAVLAVLRLLPSVPVGLSIGTGLGLIGAQVPLFSDASAPWGYGLTFAFAVACFVAYRWQRSAVLLVAGVLGSTLAVPEAVTDWTDGAVGGSMVLLLAGAVLVGASAIGLRIRRATAAPAP
jgi:hypothetical protein